MKLTYPVKTDAMFKELCKVYESIKNELSSCETVFDACQKFISLELPNIPEMVKEEVDDNFIWKKLDIFEGLVSKESGNKICYKENDSLFFNLSNSDNSIKYVAEVNDKDETVSCTLYTNFSDETPNIAIIIDNDKKLVNAFKDNKEIYSITF